MKNPVILYQIHCDPPHIPELAGKLLPGMAIPLLKG
jgi:hypothetical protein